ncbi:YbfB/YjiJ family MFS transporter [Acidiphilium sp. PA]|uniref:YbfB/YjiJ family MFS transporter n=1 Tax=Acidiphilium sp. PA TaxID=2871705 RepID=UPI002243481C|nr:YbfB/YjiJ family MFS transporter [Acidiphilium sp. PA]MCW8306452.1 YbfB/YjiJ family MFS transporter [Acidiphilium sp. PA]
MDTTARTASAREAAKVMAAGVASMVLTVGLARFLYTPLLPLMQAHAHLSVTGGGWLATINYAGYMAGTLLAASVGDLAAKFRLYRVLLLVALVGTAGMGLTTNFVMWAVLRFAAGVSAVAGLLLSSGLVLNWLRQHGRRLELGIHFGGVGLGIAVSGLLAVLMAGSLNWADQWLVAGAAGLLLLIPALGWMPAPVPVSGHHGVPTDHPPSRAWLVLFTLAYFCAGVGYVVSATFIVAIAAHGPALHGYGNLVWVVVGLGAMPSCPLWDRVARRFGDKRALLAAFGLLFASIMLSALSAGLAFLLLGALIYGASFNGITSMILSIIGRLFPSNPAKAMARLTISFGAAQIIAPAASGMIAALTGSYRGALFMAAATMLVGMALLAAMPRNPGEA